MFMLLLSFLPSCSSSQSTSNLDLPKIPKRPHLEDLLMSLRNNMPLVQMIQGFDDNQMVDVLNNEEEIDQIKNKK